MPLHTTSNPAKRAEHIAHRESKNLMDNPSTYIEGIEQWLEVYDQSLLELTVTKNNF